MRVMLAITALWFSTSAQATEIEYLLYDDDSGVQLVWDQTASPSADLPNANTLPSGQSVLVEMRNVQGTARVCMSYRATSTGPWHDFCAVPDSGSNDVYGVHWVGDVALALYYAPSGTFNANQFLEGPGLPSASSAKCSATCDDGSSCTATCTSGGCTAVCSPSASCVCD